MENITNRIQDLIDRGALFVVNHSGGKDSHAMFLHLTQEWAIPSDQILVIHADLGEADWDGLQAQIRNTTHGYDLEVVKANWKDGAPKEFLDMVEQRGEWPSPSIRQCTSDLKRTPIEKAIRHALKGRDSKLIVSCQGLRAEESCSRAKATVFKFDARNSKAGREWYQWLPIHDWTESQVFGRIEAAGQKAFWVYEAGMSRASCAFCIMASKCDLRRAAELNPKLYAKYVAMEKKIGRTFLMPTKKNGKRTLEQATGLTVEQAQEANRHERDSAAA